MSTVHRHSLRCALALALSAPPAAIAAPEDIWQEPTFQRKLLLSFAPLAEVEPQLGEGEEELFGELAALLPDGKLEARDRALAHLREHEDASAQFDFLAGSLYMQDGNTARASLLYEAAIKKFDNFLRAHQNYGYLLAQSQRFDLATKHLSRAVSLGAADGTLYGVLGTCCLSTHNYPQAESAFRNAILLEPGKSDWSLGLAQSLLLQEQFGSAAAVIGKLIEADPMDAGLWKTQAQAYIGLKDHLKAAANFEFLDGIGKLPPEELKLLGDIYREEGLLGLASETYARSFRAQPSKDPEAMIQTAEVLMYRDGQKEAERLLASVEAIAGDELDRHSKASILRLRAKIASDAGDLGAAAARLEQALDLSPTDGKAIIALGNTLKENGENEKASLIYARAYEIEGFRSLARVKTAQLLVDEDEVREAIDLIKEAQSIEFNEKVADYLANLEAFQKRRGG